MSDGERERGRGEMGRGKGRGRGGQGERRTGAAWAAAWTSAMLLTLAVAAWVGNADRVDR